MEASGKEQFICVAAEHNSGMGEKKHRSLLAFAERHIMQCSDTQALTVPKPLVEFHYHIWWMWMPPHDFTGVPVPPVRRNARSLQKLGIIISGRISTVFAFRNGIPYVFCKRLGVVQYLHHNCDKTDIAAGKSAWTFATCGTFTTFWAGFALLPILVANCMRRHAVIKTNWTW